MINLILNRLKFLLLIKSLNMKKLLSIMILLLSKELTSISSVMEIRPLSTSPLYYTMIDYSKKQLFIEALPFYVSMYDTNQITHNIMPDGKATLNFNQQGQGDLNPTWMNLISNNGLANYNSQVTFTPEQYQTGIFLHSYKEYKSFFLDIRTALVKEATKIAMSEVGGKNGDNPDIMNALQAFTQSSWNFGKIGELNELVGFSNFQILIGGTKKIQKQTDSLDLFLAAFALIEVPSGKGSVSEWLFAPQVGTNHWGLGFGFESLMSKDEDIKFMIGGNYRYLLQAWEVRSFDLTDNGPWSRYLSVQNLYGLPTAPATLGLPGINFFTQPAQIEGRSQINLFTRTEKQLGKCAFELSYNFFYTQAETINKITEIIPGYGIYALTGPGGGVGGVTTASHATINEDVPPLDPVGEFVELSTSMFDKSSGSAKSYLTNTLNFDIQRVEENYIYGFGSSIEVAASIGAITSWAIWLKFEYLFANTPHEYDKNGDRL